MSDDAGQAGIPILDQVALDRGGHQVAAPRNVVYSTGPRIFWGANEIEYVVKGPEPEVVAAEAVGYLLARELGIAVPGFAVGLWDDGYHFASEKLTMAMRNPEPFLDDHLEELAWVVVLDVLLCNDDRNFGSLLVDSTEDGRELVAIDFEKSVAVRSRHPIIACNMVPAARLWPSEELGRRLQGQSLPQDAVDCVSGLRDDRLDAIVEAVSTAVPDYVWCGNSADALKHRRDQIGELATEVWT